jgi:hypothetical protein
VTNLKAICQAHQRDLWIAAVLLLLVLGVYGPVRHFGFVNFDDPLYVTKNLHVQSGLSVDGLRWAMTSVDGANWNPLTWISLMTDVEIFDVRPGPMHLTNVVLHAISTLVLFGLFQRMTGEWAPSAMVAFLFGLHPQHVESVAWISERKDVLSGLFWMLTLWSYVAYVSRPKPVKYLLTLLLYLLGLAAKPMLVSLPLAMLLLDIWPLRRVVFNASGARANLRLALPFIWEKVPFLVLAAAISATAFVAQKQAGMVQSLDVVPLGKRLGNAVISGAVYVEKTVWPTQMAIAYPLPARQPAWEVILAGLVLVSITVLVLLCYRKRPYLAIGWFWYLITVLPVIGIVQLGFQGRADRYTYIPGIGLFIMLCWGAADIWRRWPAAQPVLTGICSVACLACVWLSWIQIGYWQNSITLFQHAIEVTPDSFAAYGRLGDAFRDEGLYGEAIANYRKVLEIEPHEKGGLSNLAAALSRVGRNDEAIAPLTELARLQPDNAVDQKNLGVALLNQGHANEALAHFAAAVRLQPDNAEAQGAMGVALSNLGRVDEAIVHFSEALRIDPDDIAARDRLQSALALKAKAGRR